ncbi:MULTISPECIES: AEC family transporter [Vitreoscilla]|uniref:AEC family transporter n=1 Tax=Vitreoscilla stercoraria TaxID=61 RepID=A0ABY4EHF5_VITST|nr:MULTISPECIES: AEC family transporter [Vitreoscilla]AUZ05794.1 membrane transport protein [Vitreoscilla sp. C1]UOO92832.1 AEC family transporter [Vitreoscilla stercoraria]
MEQMVLALFPAIALIASGYVCKRQNFFGADFWAGAEKLNYYVLFPALLFLSLSKANITWQPLVQVVWAMLMVVGVVAALVFWLGQKYHISPQRLGVYMQSNIRFNTYIGLAVVSTLADGLGAPILAVIMAVSIPLVNVLSIVSLLPKEQMNLPNILKSLFKNPLIASCVAGSVVNVLNIPIWAGLGQLLQLFSNSSLTLGLLCVGAALQFGQIKQNAHWVVLHSVSKLLLLPVLAFGVCWLFGLSPLATQVLVVFFGLPTASASYVLTKVLNGDAVLMAGIISLQTVLSVLTLPALMYFLL